ncbi:hypothetical protein [Prevotella intermedia]|uniref:Uncharacterized protein n=1 Tax=Prevotella intermedia TaxID=28131 RepID=A0A2G9IHQ6_PREIN|nr:hypothetical protein [Prevotella intermedia]PIN29297.1 hypothetical protein CUC04_07810 [Prevotella intermedia]
MVTNSILQRIKDIADEQIRDHETMTRPDLAFELRQYGVKGDSLEVDKLVFEAYSFYKNSKTIKDTFVTQDSNKSIVSLYLLHNAIDKADYKDVQTLMTKSLSTVDSSLSELDKQLKENLAGTSIKIATGVANIASGNSAVVKIQKEASFLFERYTNMVNSYESSKTDITDLTKQFVYLRNDIVAQYRRYGTALIDIFGDSIKVLEPELFDFDSIEWLEVQNMLQNRNLEYSRLSETCTQLMTSISAGFKNMLENSANVYRAVGNKGVGLALAGLNYLSHFVNAHTEATKLEAELQMFKNNIHKDGTLIKTDLIRLLSIYKSMNDVNIPKANAFYRFSGKVLNSELDAMIDSLYGTEELMQLKEQRDNIFAKYKKLENIVVDHQLNIDNCIKIIQDHRQLIGNLEGDYNHAIKIKPNKPSVIVNLLTFGSKGKAFNRELYEWMQQHSPIVKQYQNLHVDVKLYEDDLAFHKAALSNVETDYLSLKQQLKSVNSTIRKALLVSNETKVKFTDSLSCIVGVLRLAREIANTSLINSQVKVVKGIKLDNIIVPENVQQSISSLTAMLKEGMASSVKEEPEKSLKVLNEMRNYQAQEICKTETDTQTLVKINSSDSKITKNDIRNIQNATIQSVDSIAHLFEAHAKLNVLKEESNIAIELYDAQMHALQKKFKLIIEGVNNKSVVLRETMKQLNTTQEANKLKETLLSLSDGEILLSEREIDEFLNDNKIIEL